MGRRPGVGGGHGGRFAPKNLTSKITQRNSGVVRGVRESAKIAPYDGTLCSAAVAAVADKQRERATSAASRFELARS